MKLFGTTKIGENGHLYIGGCDSVDLSSEFGTPLYVVDEQLVRDNCRRFKNSFVMDGIKTDVIYASKAFINIAMCKLINEEGLSLDVVSGGELYTALKAGFPAEKIYMHGNNKSVEELTMAIEAGVGRIIVDNMSEMELIEKVCGRSGRSVKVLLRVNPGIEAHTHEYIKTTKNDSKFGESIFSSNIRDLINSCRDSKFIELMGFHCHIGSQIFQEKSFYEEIRVMFQFIKNIKDECSFITTELNLGGGFGVYYTDEDKPFGLEQFTERALNIVKDKAAEYGMELPRLMIEPGRAIIANAGTTLYKAGSIKETYGGRKYVFVDGGMNENPRTALYGAKYYAAVANRMNDKSMDIYTITGKCCESGDIIIKDTKLAKPDKGDIIAVFTTGAYNYSMSSNYNRLPRPSVVFVKDGQARLVVKRETYEDLIRNDIAM